MSLTIGAFLFADEWQPWSADEAARAFEQLAACGVNAIITESETYRDDLIVLAHRAGLRWIASIACFSDHAHQNNVLEERPELWPVDEHGERRAPMEWYVGVVPTFEDYNASRVHLAESIARNHAVDGLLLDFIRWPIHWELELRPEALPPRESSFDAHTLARFEAESGAQLPPAEAGIGERVRWIRAHAAEEWLSFKCRVITTLVREATARIRAIRGTSFTVGVFTLPLPSNNLEAIAGQKLSDLASLVNWIAPMAYHAIVHRPPSWVAEVIEHATRVAPGQTLPVVQISSAEGAEPGADWGPPISPAEAEQVIRLALDANGVCGLIAFPGSALLRDDRRALLLHQAVS
jgi:hypothetical protein